MTDRRALAVRTIAASLCFDQDPPPVRSLGPARAAAESIVDALVAASLLGPEYAPPAPAVVTQLTMAGADNGEVAFP